MFRPSNLGKGTKNRPDKNLAEPLSPRIEKGHKGPLCQSFRTQGNGALEASDPTEFFGTQDSEYATENVNRC